MKISKLYANNTSFKMIRFDKGINFILSQNNGVGKSSLFKLIDFCLLGDKGFLANEHFKDYIFYIELQIASNRYITIKRPTIGGKNIELKITKEKSILLDEKSFNKKGSLGVAKSFLENKVNYSINKFRTYITYFLRDENNQDHPFILNRFANAHESEYKTVISNLIGIDGRKIKRKYDLEKQIEKLETNSTEVKVLKNDLEKQIEENKTLITNHFIEKLQINISKYGKIVLDKDISFLIGFNASNDIEFSIGTEIDNKLLSFIFEAALADTYAQKRLIKFVAFDCPFDEDKNIYEEGIYDAIYELYRRGIQTIITSNESAIHNQQNLIEIKDEFLTGFLSNDDKLMGEF